MSITIYHNPRCTKSRQTLDLLKEKGVTPEVVLYLESPPDAAALKDLKAKLGLESARDMMRTKEAAYKDQGLKDVADEDALIRAMAETPILIERPIVVNRDKARIGRPPETVLEIL
ncbi:arsenate reductase (glutaredoxin) [Marivibrio halodurans]|uniref:Arsenate reductase n=1 Tax=Marivibrio halodurans TaxID=2039722 RepID=A0A8J7V2Z0_9PROT|nr:arsenate reductase (glutaredoxin) [Marivibrio halodurans]MBP5857382.1 arsenate reductase (glutaredoxin) [Marivibrio halodurans]